MNILHTINHERATFGFSAKDHARYHKHLTSRLAKLRASLGLQYSSGSGSKSKPFKKVELIPASQVKDPRYLELLLLEAERAHTASLFMHETYLSTPSDRRSANQLHRIRTRSHRAIQHGSHLTSTLSGLSSDMQVSIEVEAEAKIYELVLQATHLHLFQDAYLDALPLWIVIRGLMSRLAAAYAQESGRKEAMVLGWMDEWVDPRIRYAAWKLGRRSGETEGVEGVLGDFEDEIEGLVDEFGVRRLMDGLSDKQGGQGGTPGERTVRWLGQDIEVRNPDVVGALGNVTKALARLDAFNRKKGEKKRKGGKMKAFDRVLGSLDDAAGLVGRIIEETRSNAMATGSTSAQSTSLPILLDYLHHTLYTQRITRDLLLIRSILRPFPHPFPLSTDRTEARPTKDTPPTDDALMRSLPGVLKLYDSVIGSFEKIRVLDVVEHAQIPALEKQTSPEDEEEEESGVGECIEKKIAFFRAQRIGYLALLYHLLPSEGSTTNALLVLSKASLLLRQIHRLPTTYPSDLTPVSDEAVLQLEQQLRAFETVEKVRLWEETERKSPADFLDLAFNFVELERGEEGAESAGIVRPQGRERDQSDKQVEDEQEAEVEEEEEDEEEVRNEGGKKKGWLGGWFGRG